MMTTRSFTVAVLGLALFAAVGLAQQPVGSMADIQADYEAGNWADVIKKSGTALNARGNAAVGLDRAQVQVWRGEAYIRLKQFPNAITAFNSAAKETSESKNVSLWSATAMLLQRSPGGKYTPRQPTADGSRAPIDIVEAESRKNALLALFNDEYKLMQPKVAQQQNQAQIPPLAEAIKQAGTLRNLEVAATGEDKAVGQLIDTLGGRAAKLMGDEVQTLSSQVEKLNQMASQSSADAAGADPRYSAAQASTQKRGLTTTDVRALNSVQMTLKQINDACDQFTAAVGSDRLFAPVKEDTARLSQRAADVLNANYTGNKTPVQIQRGRGY